MTKEWIVPKKKYYKSKKSNHKCAGCGKEFPDNLLFSYVDGNNVAITRNSKDYCWKCYNEKYPNDKISIFTVLRQYGYNIEVFPMNMVVYINDKEYKIIETLKDELIKEYNL